MTVSADQILKAASLLKEGSLVVFPTETVYGLGGNALSDDAVAAIYAAKGRPQFNPLIVHMRSLEDAAAHVKVNNKAIALARAFWPGPLTMVLPRREDSTLSLLVSAGLDSVAVRVPAHPVAQGLLHEAGIPVAAPSANRSGRVSSTDAAHVQEEFGDDIIILDDGPCHVGIESTVIDLTEDKAAILRPGSITQSMLEKVIGAIDRVGAGEVYKSPGMLERHYAPAHPLRLNAKDVRAGEALLAFGPNVFEGAVATENLSHNGDLREAAANLFRMLRKLDASGAKSIAAMAIPEEGLGVAINDRLRRAAQ